MSLAPSTAATRLPLQLTSFVGREQEIAAARRLLASSRLLTLTGAGGSGKTRLALEIAAREQPGYGQGVAWIELTAIADPALLPGTVASLLQIHEQPARSTSEALSESLRDRCVLLLLDSCEHLVDACAVLAEKLLRDCPMVRILATSREALGVPGEIAWLVPSLSLPLRRGDTPADVGQSEAGQLFVERARAVMPNFALCDANAAAVGQICRRLDGIPLAIELAAARLRALSPVQIAGRLDDCFRLLTSGSRLAIPRHQTLRAAIDWSYALLSVQERLLLDRLSVFAGSFSLDAAEAICAGGPISRDEVLDLISDLIEKSLVEVLVWTDVARYRLLESVDQYGTERLAAQGEAAELQRRHAEFFLALAEEAEPHLTGPRRSEWLEPMMAEADNFRAALAWSRDTDTELHLRLIGALRMLWLAWGSYREARHWFETALTLPGATEPTRGRAAALLTAGALAAMQMENAVARPWLEESERLWRHLGEARQESYAQIYLAATLFEVDLDSAIEMLRSARSRFRALDEPFGESICLTALGVAVQSGGDHQAATAALKEAVGIARAVGIEHNTALPLQFLASSLLHQGESEKPLLLLREAVAALRRDPEYVYLSRALWVLAAVLFRHGARLDGVRLLGAAEALRERIGAVVAAFDRAAYEETVTVARAALDGAAFAAAWAEGRRLDPEQAIELALGSDEAGSGAGSPAPAAPVAPAAPQPLVADTATTASAPAQLCVRALGPFELEREDTPLEPVDWRHARPRELFAYLLCFPQGRTREQIGAALWPEAAPTQVRNNFHVALHHLRKVLGNAAWIQHERDRYRLDPDLRYEFDAARFETEISDALREPRSAPPPVERLREALSLYRGDFLEGELVGDWHLEQRDRLRHLYVEGLMMLGGALFDEARYAEAAEVYQRVIVKDDLREDAHRRLILCRARLGERAHAMRHYQGLLQLLDVELETTPEPATVELFERLQRGESI
jgi:predicted ATPase/DNA-binding SARP family transcriptional activator